MRKVLSLFLSLLLALTPCMAQACQHTPSPASGTEVIASPVPSIALEDLYDITGSAYFFNNSKFDYISMIRSFSENIIDCIPIVLLVNEIYHDAYFTLSHPIAEMYYPCFIIDADCNLIGNVEYNYLVCTCGEWWYDVSITVAPGKYQPDQVVYLVWVE